MKWKFILPLLASFTLLAGACEFVFGECGDSEKYIAQPGSYELHSTRASSVNPIGHPHSDAVEPVLLVVDREAGTMVFSYNLQDGSLVEEVFSFSKEKYD